MSVDRPLDEVGVDVSVILVIPRGVASLNRTLQSLRGVGKDLFVIDLYPGEEAGAVAAREGAHYIPTQESEFESALIRAVAAASGQWVLWMECGQELAYESRAAIKYAVVRPQFGAFQVQTLGLDGMPRGSRPRLMRRNAHMKFLAASSFDYEAKLEEGCRVADLPGASIVQFEDIPTKPMNAHSHPNSDQNSTGPSLHDALTAWTEADFPKAIELAKQFAERLQDGDPLGQCAYRIWAGALTDAGHHEQGIEVCDVAHRAGFGGAAIEYERARGLRETGSKKEALIAATRSLAGEWPENSGLSPEEADAARFVLRGHLLFEIGEASQSASMFDRALRAQPHNGEALVGKARAFEVLGLFDVALECYMSGQGHPDVGQTCLKSAGRICSKIGAPKRSVELYRQAWSTDSEDREAWDGWRQAAEESGSIDETLSAYEALDRQCGLQYEDWISWGRTLEEADRADAALAAYARAGESSPEEASPHFLSGSLLARVGRKEQAAESLERGLKLDEFNAEAWFALGRILAEIGLLHGAKVSFQRGLSLAPGDTHALKQFQDICRAA